MEQKYLNSLFINSDDRPLGDPINSFQINGGFNRNYISYIAVNRCNFKNLLYNINSTNNKLYYLYTPTLAVQQVTTIPVGLYTPSTFAAQLQINLRATTGDVAITVTYSTETQKITINSNGASTFQFYSTLLTSSIAQQIGLVIDKKDNTVASLYPAVAAASVVMNHPVNLVYTKYLDFCSNELTKYKMEDIFKTPTTKLIYRLYVNDITNQTTSTQITRNLLFIDWKKYEGLSSYDLSVYDDQGNLAQLNNSPFTLELALFKCD